MTKTEVLKSLEACGTAQNRKVYARHGVCDEMFGVSYANLKKLAKQIRVDQALAAELWESGNHDARVLATMIADPQHTTQKQLSAWVKDLNNDVLAGALAGVASQTASARKCMEKWIDSRSEWMASTGWTVLARLAMTDDSLSDEELERFLGVIEATLHGSKNRVRYSMNNALIAIGIRNPRLQKQAIAAAQRIGKVEVDHGETGCKTPDAAEYIRRTAARKDAGGRVRARC